MITQNTFFFFLPFSRWARSLRTAENRITDAVFHQRLIPREASNANAQTSSVQGWDEGLLGKGSLSQGLRPKFNPWYPRGDPVLHTQNKQVAKQNTSKSPEKRNYVCHKSLLNGIFVVFWLQNVQFTHENVAFFFFFKLLFVLGSAGRAWFDVAVLFQLPRRGMFRRSLTVTGIQGRT